MRLLVVGAAGQLGGELARQALRAGDEVHGTYRTRPPSVPGLLSAPLDKTDPVAVDRLVGSLRPDAVIDTAALHNVDYCEAHPDEAHRVNRDGSATLAAAARAVGARFVFVSTDYVFDGRGHPPYAEEDPPRPISVYGASKLAGEQAVLAAHPGAAVARPSVVYSWVPPEAAGPTSSGKPLNFASWLVHETRRGRPLRIVRDQVGSPTLAEDLAAALLALVGHDARGLFHTAGATAVNRYEFAQRLLRAVDLPTDGLSAITTAELKQAARRPPDSSLRTTRLPAATGHTMLELDAALRRFAAAMGPPAAGAGR
jgi:dTDP-4-dehydrorhamnose reductase